MNKEIEGIINYYISNSIARDKVINYIEELKLVRSTCAFCPYYTENKQLKEEINELTVESTEWEDRYYRLQDKWDVSIIELERENKELHNKIDNCLELLGQHLPSYASCIKLLDELEEILKDSDVDD